MSNAEKMNLERLPWVLDGLMIWATSNGWYLALLIWVLTIGVGEFFRVIEDAATDFAPFVRPRFWGYFYGDWALAGLGLVADSQLNRFQGSDRFYVQPWWYAIMVGLGMVLSVWLEIGAIRANLENPEKGYTWQQEMMPSKLVHTIGFGLVFGLLLSLAPVVVLSGTIIQRVVAIALTLILVGIWVGFNVADNKLRNMTYLLVEAHPHPSRFAQKEWLWRK